MPFRMLTMFLAFVASVDVAPSASADPRVIFTDLAHVKGPFSSGSEWEPHFDRIARNASLFLLLHEMEM